jgi:hypothetical protein
VNPTGRIKEITSEMINANQKSLENQLRAWDQKLVKLRNEIDFNGINKKINSLAT